MQRAMQQTRKIVVTTTVNLDGADNPVAVTAEANGNGAVASATLTRMQPDGVAVTGLGARSITCFEVAPYTYLGLTGSRRRVSLLQIDQHIFIFAPRTTATEKLEMLVRRILNAMQDMGRDVNRILWSGALSPNGGKGIGLDGILDSDAPFGGVRNAKTQANIVHLTDAQLDALEEK